MRFTLPSLIYTIKDLIQDDENSLQLFDEKLSFIGYSDLNQTDYETMFFIRRGIDNYVVTSDFPTIRLYNIPNELSHVSWDLKLDAIKNFKI